jgi:hypothetical protein
MGVTEKYVCVVKSRIVGKLGADFVSTFANREGPGAEPAQKQ